jgi:hypothetical protein
LFLLPALLQQGLLKTKEVYTWGMGAYYGLESIVLTLAFMALLRIKNPEQHTAPPGLTKPKVALLRGSGLSNMGCAQQSPAQSRAFRAERNAPQAQNFR